MLCCLGVQKDVSRIAPADCLDGADDAAEPAFLLWRLIRGTSSLLVLLSKTSRQKITKKKADAASTKKEI
jgi:hypothetical protein